VDIYNYSVYAYGGSLSIAANENVDIENSTLGAASDNNISISGSQGSASRNVFITANGGNIDISAGNDLTILNTTLDLGGNISISDSSTITANDGDVDITTGGGLSISAEGTVNVSGSEILGNNISISDSTIPAINGDVNIKNNNSLTLPDTTGFGLSQANGIKITDGSSIAANAGNAAESGNVNISTDGGVDMESSKINANSSAGIGGNVTVTAGTGITVNGASISGDTAAGTIALNNASGQATIENGASAQAFYLTVNSPDGILIDGTSGGGVHLSGNTMKLTSGNLAAKDVIAVNHEDLSSFQSVNIAGHTLDIEYTTFAGGSSVNLGSSTGTLNINNGVQPFNINLIQDNYGSTPITSAGQFTPGYSASAGLHNYAIGP